MHTWCFDEHEHDVDVIWICFSQHTTNDEIKGLRKCRKRNMRLESPNLPEQVSDQRPGVTRIQVYDVQSNSVIGETWNFFFLRYFCEHQALMDQYLDAVAWWAQARLELGHWEQESAAQVLKRASLEEDHFSTLETWTLNVSLEPLTDLHCSGESRDRMLVAWCCEEVRQLQREPILRAGLRALSVPGQPIHLSHSCPYPHILWYLYFRFQLFLLDAFYGRMSCSTCCEVASRMKMNMYQSIDWLPQKEGKKQTSFDLWTLAETVGAWGCWWYSEIQKRLHRSFKGQLIL